MLALYTAAGSVPIQADDYYIRQIYSGYDEAVFSISIWDENYRQMEEESVIIDTETGITYLIKAIDAGGDTAKVKAQIDLDDWRGTMTVPYNSGSHTVADIVRAVKPADWSVVDDSSMAIMRTIELDSATPLDVLEACRDTFPGITFRLDNNAKTVAIKNPTLNSISNGSFATRQLNLKENNYKGKSSGLYNRLYAYGKDGLSIASVNPTGQPYVDCSPAYSDRVICAYWKDDRYTVAGNLLADAQAKVNAAGVPTRSFDCNVVDLAAVDPEKYSYLSFPLFATITLIDDTRGAGGVLHQVTERWHYPLHPELDKVVLSTAPQRISSQVQQIRNDINNRNSAWYQNFLSAVSDASDWITNTNGHVYFVRDGNGLPTEIMIVNDTDPDKVWRWSAGGLGYSENGVNGPFITAITAGGEVVADFIKAGILSAVLIRSLCTDAYIRESSTAFSAQWLSLTDGGSALDPVINNIYHILTAGTYNDKYYKWDGSTYIETDPVSYWNLESGVMSLFNSLIRSQKTVYSSGTSYKIYRGVKLDDGSMSFYMGRSGSDAVEYDVGGLYAINSDNVGYDVYFLISSGDEHDLDVEAGESLYLGANNSGQNMGSVWIGSEHGEAVNIGGADENQQQAAAFNAHAQSMSFDINGNKGSSGECLMSNGQNAYWGSPSITVGRAIVGGSIAQGGSLSAYGGGTGKLICVTVTITISGQGVYSSTFSVVPGVGINIAVPVYGDYHRFNLSWSGDYVVCTKLSGQQSYTVGLFTVYLN